MPKKKEGETSFPVTLSDELDRKFTDYCKRNNRSKNKQVRHMIEREIEEDERTPK